MMSLLPLLSVIVLGPPTTVTLNGTYFLTPVGTMKVSIVPQRDRTLVQEVEMAVVLGGHHIKLSSSEVVGPTGAMLREAERQVTDGKVVSDLAITYRDRVAVVADRLTLTTKEYPAPPSAVLDNPSALWFVNIRPPVGQSSSAYTFYSDKLTWEKELRHYSRDVTVVVGGVARRGHQIEDLYVNRSIVSIVDDQSLPLDITISDIHFVRDK